MKRNSKHTTLYCFSPLVMVLTFIIEILLATYVLIRYRRNKVVRLSVLILLTLAFFQLAEYGVCEPLGLTDNFWSKFGFSIITLLPVLGLHLVHALVKKTNTILLTIAYLSAAVWIGLFLFGTIMQTAVCNGNYVIFNLQEGFGGAYFIYYYVWLMLGVVTALRFAVKAPKHLKHALIAHVVGYGLFVLPATFIWLRYEGAAQGLPSIMCGFALLYALMLALVVLPAYFRQDKAAAKSKKK